MEMLNRAIEDAADFSELKRKLQERLPTHAANERERGAIQAYINAGMSPKRPGENRTQYRERLRQEQRARLAVAK